MICDTISWAIFSLFSLHDSFFMYSLIMMFLLGMHIVVVVFVLLLNLLCLFVIACADRVM